MRKIAIGGIAVGIAVMMLSLFIVQGFQAEIRNKIIGFGAHVQVSKYSSNNSFEALPIVYPAPYFNDLFSIEGVKHIQPYASKAGIIKADDAIEGVLFKGVDKNYDWTFFTDQLSKGRLPIFEDSARSNEILISESLAKKLALSADSSLLMYFVQDPPRSRKFKISGLYNTGLQESEFDQLIIVGDIRQVQRLNNWEENMVGGVEILISNFKDIEPVGDAIYESLPPDLETSTIIERYPQIFSWLQMMDMNVIIIITLMLLVGIINMVTALLIMILERTSMIGLLKALGAQNDLIRKIFLYQSGSLIAKGMLIGNIVGLSVSWLQYNFQLIKLNAETYYVAYVPIQYDWLGFLLLNVGVFVICLVTMLLPAMLISKISPAKAMRYT
jgi:lipoprotein-releasing system permease protein